MFQCSEDKTNERKFLELGFLQVLILDLCPEPVDLCRPGVVVEVTTNAQLELLSWKWLINFAFQRARYLELQNIEDFYSDLMPVVHVRSRAGLKDGPMLPPVLGHAAW